MSGGEDNKDIKVPRLSLILAFLTRCDGFFSRKRYLIWGYRKIWWWNNIARPNCNANSKELFQTNIKIFSGESSQFWLLLPLSSQPPSSSSVALQAAASTPRMESFGTLSRTSIWSFRWSSLDSHFFTSLHFTLISPPVCCFRKCLVASTWLPCAPCSSSSTRAQESMHLEKLILDANSFAKGISCQSQTNLLEIIRTVILTCS